MKTFLMILLVPAFILTTISVTSLASSSDNDFDVYNRLATIKGNVQLLNHPEHGKVPAGGQYLVFQRNGCKYCLIATNADKDGNYRIRVGQGKYKVVVYNPSSAIYDMLAPGQARFVTAMSTIQDTQFDVNLLIPNEKK